MYDDKWLFIGTICLEIFLAGKMKRCVPGNLYIIRLEVAKLMRLAVSAEELCNYALKS